MEQAMRRERSERAWPSSWLGQPREAAPRCERRCPGAPDDEEERTGDRNEHGGGVWG